MLNLASDFRSGALPLPFAGHSISFARLPVLLFSGHLPVFPQENAFSNIFQKNAAFWKNPENIWLKFGQNSGFLKRKFKNFRKFQHSLNYRRNSDKNSSKSEQKSMKRIQKERIFAKILIKFANNAKKFDENFLKY